MVKQYLHLIKVSCEGKFFSFPIDMLRYDCLYPYSGEDSSKIHHCFENREEDNRIITLSRTAEKTWKPTVERWKSFGWRVVEHEVG